MDDLQRAERLLNSPIEGDLRKAITLLAKSGDRRALALLRQAHDKAESAEIKQLALKGGAYLKENLRAEVLAPAADPITFDLPEDQYGLDEPHTSAIQPEIEADWMRSAVKGESKREAKARKQRRKPRESAKSDRFLAILVFISSLVITFSGFLPWVSVANYPMPSGQTLGQDIADANLPDYPRPSLSLLDLGSVVFGRASVWRGFLSPGQMAQFGTMVPYPVEPYIMAGAPMSYEHLIVLIFGIGGALLSNVVWAIPSDPRQNTLSLWYMRVGRLISYLLSYLPNRLLWGIVFIFGLVMGGGLIYVLFSSLPRFLSTSYELLDITNQPMAAPLTYLDLGAWLTILCIIIVLVASIFGLTSGNEQK